MKGLYNYTIRRHLAQGKYYGWFQIRGFVSKSKQGEIVEYINPEKHNILFQNCYLYNRVGSAKKIHSGLYKEPCAWICAEQYELFKAIEDPHAVQVGYNPIKHEHWGYVNEYGDIRGNLDGQTATVLYTLGTKLYL